MNQKTERNLGIVENRFRIISCRKLTGPELAKELVVIVMSLEEICQDQSGLLKEYSKLSDNIPVYIIESTGAPLCISALEAKKDQYVSLSQLRKLTMQENFPRNFSHAAYVDYVLQEVYMSLMTIYELIKNECKKSE